MTTEAKIFSSHTFSLPVLALLLFFCCCMLREYGLNEIIVRNIVLYSGGSSEIYERMKNESKIGKNSCKWRRPLIYINKLWLWDFRRSSNNCYLVNALSIYHQRAKKGKYWSEICIGGSLSFSFIFCTIANLLHRKILLAALGIKL